MTDNEVQVEVQLASSESESGQHEIESQQEDITGEREADCTEGLQNNGQGEVEESLMLLADVALAQPCGDNTICSCDCEASSCLEIRPVEESLQSMQLQLQFLMSKADDLQDCLINGQDSVEGEALAAAVLCFLYTCQPYFNHLETTARSTLSQLTPLSFDIFTRRMQLLDFSQQLCDRLEQLVLTYARYSLLCLDETEPNSVSYFCIGQHQLGQLRLSTFLYCRPVPYLAQTDTGLYKRMRWNVDRLRNEQQTDEGHGGKRHPETVWDTEYYFLCCEDIATAHEEVDRNGIGVSPGNVVRMWSIGQWVQVYPDPDTEDIYDWIMCEVPHASYNRLLLLGSDEPSSCSATDFLQQLLLSQQTSPRAGSVCACVSTRDICI